MKVLEVICNNCNLFNLIPTKEIELNKEFICDNDSHICKDTILIVDEELLNQLSK
jgi:hypothetical protein